MRVGQISIEHGVVHCGPFDNTVCDAYEYVSFIRVKKVVGYKVLGGIQMLSERWQRDELKYIWYFNENIFILRLKSLEYVCVRAQ